MVSWMGRRRGMKWTQSWSKSLQNVCKLLCKFMIKQNLVSFFVKYLEEVKVQYLRKQKTHSNIKMQLVRWVIHFPVNTETPVYSAMQACIIRETHSCHHGRGVTSDISPGGPWCGHSPVSPHRRWWQPLITLITHHSAHVTLIAPSSRETIDKQIRW